MDGSSSWRPFMLVTFFTHLIGKSIAERINSCSCEQEYVNFSHLLYISRCI